MQRKYWIIATLLLTLGACSTQASWGEAGQSQYHIQTDEGPERYFRFQTDNGQFRKEKRLQDGTVIGTEAWIDAAGYLRQKDYIADKKGYRILKSKTIYVGQGRPIEDAIKSTKSAPAQSGVLVDGSAGLNSIVQQAPASAVGYTYSTTSTTPIPPATSTVATQTLPTQHDIPHDSGIGKLNYLSPAEAARIQPSGYLGFDHYPDELPRAHAQLHAVKSGQPIVHIRNNGAPIDEFDNSNALNVYDEQSFVSTTPSTPLARPPTPAPTIAAPALAMQPPIAPVYRRRLRPVGIASTTPAPISAQDASNYDIGEIIASSPAPFATRTTPAPPAYHYAPTAPLTNNIGGYGYYTPNTPYDVNSLDGGLLPPLPATTYRRRLRPVHSNNLDIPEYDGVSTTRNGFRYILPRHYHEEEQINAQQRAGSFGYVDPFGIRRVVYYNASPERGFVHRNNNQYVGLGVTPFDAPGPIND